MIIGGGEGFLWGGVCVYVRTLFSVNLPLVCSENNYDCSVLSHDREKILLPYWFASYLVTWSYCAGRSQDGCRHARNVSAGDQVALHDQNIVTMILLVALAAE